MRYIAIFLVLVNIGYFAWRQSRPEQAAPVRETRPLLNSGIMLREEFELQSAGQRRLNAEANYLCTLVNGFVDLDEANSLMAEARAGGLGALLDLSGEPLDSRYRLFLPPASSRDLATIALDGLSERMAQADIEVEPYVITQGLLENAVALGAFDSVAAAEDMREAIVGLGYAAEITEIPRSDGEIQLWLKPRVSGPLEASQWLDLSAERPHLTRSENLCQTIAQASQFP